MALTFRDWQQPWARCVWRRTSMVPAPARRHGTAARFRRAGTVIGPLCVDRGQTIVVTAPTRPATEASMGIRSRTGLLAGAFLGALAAALPAASATAAPAHPGLTMRVQAGDPSAPAIVLTNGTGAPCQVVRNALGTVGITSIGQ